MYSYTKIHSLLRIRKTELSIIIKSEVILEQLKEKFFESIISVIPIFAIVLVLSITISPFNSGVLVLFLFGAILLIFGMALFTLGSGMSMTPLGEGIGIEMSKAKKLWIPLILCFILGMLITISEPDLTVLAEQIPSIPNMTLILSVAVGVGIFLAIAVLRLHLGIPLTRLFLIFYAAVFILAAFAPASFIPAAFDSGGVTTGPVTVPFIMAMGAGLAAIRSNRSSRTDSFGLVALCSIGPILSVLLLSIFYAPEATSAPVVIAEIQTTKDAILAFTNGLPHYAKEVLIAFSPIILVFVLFQAIFKRFLKHQMIRIIIGMLYTYAGLVLFLTAANIGFMPAGNLIGSIIAGSKHKYWLIPVGALFGYFVVAAEPAVVVLKKQVEEISNGAISQRSIGLGLSIGVAFSVAVSMLRVITGIPIQPFLYAGYALSLIISFFVPSLYTAVAFDSGGVASGPMTSTFILPFAVGACTALGGNIMTDAFGIVAMVAMTPLITIQGIGLVSSIRQRARRKQKVEAMGLVPDVMVYYEKAR